MTRIYLIRHAAAEGNLYRVAHGQYNSTITSRGYRQLAWLRKRFEGVELDAVYGSDLLRAQTTASALYVPRDLPFRPMPLLREIRMGAWEQLSWGEIARQDAEMYHNFNHRPDLFVVEGAETCAEVRDRMLTAVRCIASEYPDGTVAATSHGVALRILLGTLEGLSLAEIGETPYGDNTAVSLLEVEGDEIRLVYRDDASHVPAGAKVHRRGISADSDGKYTVVATQPGLWYRVLWETIETIELEAMLGEERVGRLALCMENGVFRITEYTILPGRRGQHFSVQLLGQAVKYARKHDFDEITAACGEDMVPYFEKHGFAVIGKRGAETEMVMDIRRVIRPIPMPECGE